MKETSSAESKERQTANNLVRNVAGMIGGQGDYVTALRNYLLGSDKDYENASLFFTSVEMVRLIKNSERGKQEIALLEVAFNIKQELQEPDKDKNEVSSELYKQYAIALTAMDKISSIAAEPDNIFSEQALSSLREKTPRSLSGKAGYAIDYYRAQAKEKQLQAENSKSPDAVEKAETFRVINRNIVFHRYNDSYYNEAFTTGQMPYGAVSNDALPILMTEAFSKYGKIAVQQYQRSIDNFMDYIYDLAKAGVVKQSVVDDIFFEHIYTTHPDKMLQPDIDAIMSELKDNGSKLTSQHKEELNQLLGAVEGQFAEMKQKVETSDLSRPDIFVVPDKITKENQGAQYGLISGSDIAAQVVQNLPVKKEQQAIAKNSISQLLAETVDGKEAYFPIAQKDLFVSALTDGLSSVTDFTKDKSVGAKIEKSLENTVKNPNFPQHNEHIIDNIADSLLQEMNFTREGTKLPPSNVRQVAKELSPAKDKSDVQNTQQQPQQLRQSNIADPVENITQPNLMERAFPTLAKLYNKAKDYIKGKWTEYLEARNAQQEKLRPDDKIHLP